MKECAICQRSLPESSFRIRERKSGASYQEERCSDCMKTKYLAVFGKNRTENKVNYRQALMRWRKALDSKRSSPDLWDSLADIPDLVAALFEREALLEKYTAVFNTMLSVEQKAQINLIEDMHGLEYNG